MPLIPAKNPAALVGYYLGVCCLIPCVGFLLALPALVCGIVGVVKARSTPEVGGMGHAVAAIILSVMGPLLWVGGFLFLSRL